MGNRNETLPDNDFMVSYETLFENAKKRRNRKIDYYDDENNVKDNKDGLGSPE